MRPTSRLIIPKAGTIYVAHARSPLKREREREDGENEDAKAEPESESEGFSTMQKASVQKFLRRKGSKEEEEEEEEKKEEGRKERKEEGKGAAFTQDICSSGSNSERRDEMGSESQIKEHKQGDKPAEVDKSKEKWEER